jgi:hypothetical protein
LFALAPSDKEVAMKIAVLAMTLGLVAAGVASVAPADTARTGVAAVQAAPEKQKVLVGFYANSTVRYFDFGPINLRPGNKIGSTWIFANGAAGQRPIVDTAPGDARYSPLRRVTTVTWSANATPQVLRSAQAVRAAADKGEVTLTRTTRVVNAPLLGFGQTRHAGFARGKLIHYYELGTLKLAGGNEVLPIWTFTNGERGQRNIADVVPGRTAYTPLWAVVEVTWKAGAERRLVRSFEQLQQARQAGDVTLVRTPVVVNCPFV